MADEDTGTDITLPDVPVTATRLPLPVPPIPPRPRTPPQPQQYTAAGESVGTPPGPDPLQSAPPLNSKLPSAYAFTAIVLVNGVNIGPPFSFQVSRNGYYQADRYYCELLLGALPDKYQDAFWADGDQKQIEIRCGINQQNSRSLIIGLIDEVRQDWVERTITLRGRDLSSLLIDNKTAEKFPNMTASQVAQLLAKRRGLQASITATTTLVGVYFQREYARLSGDVTEHDMLTYLAEQEGYKYWVEGNTLHFEQPPPDNSKPFVVNYTPATQASIANGTFIHLETKRNETLAKDIKVKAISWDGKHKRMIEATATQTRTRSTSTVTRNTVAPSGQVQQHVLRVTGYNLAQLQAYANQQALLISKQERECRIEMPFDPVLDPRKRVSLRGTKTPFDQPYYIDSIDYSGSAAQGSRMELVCRNSSPQSQVTLS